MTTKLFSKQKNGQAIRSIILLGLFIPVLSFAQTNSPTGKEIASMAKNYRELKQFKKTDILNGKKMSFTPVELIDSTKHGNGFLLGIMENELVGGQTGLPPGRYNLFFNEVNGKPHVYAEANGVIVKEAARVTVDKAKDVSDKKPKISFNSTGTNKSVFAQYYWYMSYYPGSSSLYTSTTYSPCMFCIYSVYF